MSESIKLNNAGNSSGAKSIIFGIKNMEQIKVKKTVGIENQKDCILGETVILRFSHDARSAFWRGAKRNCFVSEYTDAETGLKAYEIFKRPEAEPEAERVIIQAKNPDNRHND